MLLVMIIAKSSDSSFQFYKKAAVYAVVVSLFAILVQSNINILLTLVFGLIKFGLALPYFWLLDRTEDTVLTWVFVFAIGGLLLGMF